MSPLEKLLFAITIIFSGFTYPLICAIYFKTLLRRRNEIEKLLQGRFMEKYTRAYGGLSPNDLFNLYHNWKDYILPVALNVMVVSCISAALLLQGSGYIKSGSNPLSIFNKLPYSAAAGFIGAYIFSHYDMVRRFSTMDLTSTIVYRLWLRLLVGGTLGYLVGSILQAQFQMLTAFCLGAFPVNKLRDLMKQMIQKKIDVSVEAAMAEKPNLHKLQGLTEETIERLEEEDITTTQHLALANPILLLLKPNLQWTVILDMIGQAILYIFIGDKIEEHRAIGIRSAIDLVKVHCLMLDPDENKREVGRQLADLMSTKLGQDRIGIYNLIQSVSENPQTRFICDLWQETCEEVRVYQQNFQPR